MLREQASLLFRSVASHFENDGPESAILKRRPGKRYPDICTPKDVLFQCFFLNVSKLANEGGGGEGRDDALVSPSSKPVQPIDQAFYNCQAMKAIILK